MADNRTRNELDVLYAVKEAALALIAAHDNNDWSDKTHGTDLGDAVDALRDALGMEKPEDA